MYSSALNHGPPTLANGLLNGTNTWTRNGATLGKRLAVPVNTGESYRIRLINGAIDTHFKFTIDNHTMTVIAADFVPIVPYQTTVLDIAMGQRYDIVVEADQASLASNFWMRAIPQSSCSSNANADDIRGIMYYGTEPNTPSTTCYDYKDACVDEPMARLVPNLHLDAGEQDHSDDEVVGLNRAEGVFLWTMHSVSFNASWTNPTLLQMHNNNAIASFATQDHVIQLDEANKWEYLIIHSTIPVPHPIHLHGHDFYILAQGNGPYDSSAAVKLFNPPRRDVAVIPASGHLVIAFKTDNPGAWLVHCHIGWHTDMGLALQFVEQYGVARELVDYDRLNRTCKAWNDYAAAEGVVQYKYDDGI
ncbi:Multicopper oxidase, type 3 [Akanthomyces lecanii RCEF 1005]|uniref:Multicopper oxidase, type 3 n=1 Tax=Akanthomyces lecanii RCEF 1005 TaxID=1081108 RepID=A0A162KV79_CORDF|nr:Multicopper oxidase, type 3 [Akanthomyces lecanii RCEF 1005]